MVSLLVPRTKWQLEQPALEPGAIVLVQYAQKYGKDRYRLGRVVDVRRDQDNLVRTAWVGLRNLRRAIREEADVCRAGLAFVELPVQRLVMVLPPEEQPPEVLHRLAHFPKMPGKRQELPEDPHPPEVRLAGQEGEGLQPGRRQPPRIQVQVQEQPEEMADLPRPQRARGRPRRAQ